MATKEFLEGMLKLFSEAIQKREITEDLLNTYYRALNRYSERELRHAVDKCFDDLRYFPKITDIKDRIPIATNETIQILHGYPCQVCGEIRDCMKDEGIRKCRNCYSGLIDEQISQRFKDVIRVMDKDTDFIPKWYTGKLSPKNR